MTDPSCPIIPTNPRQRLATPRLPRSPWSKSARYTAPASPARRPTETPWCVSCCVSRLFLLLHKPLSPTAHPSLSRLVLVGRNRQMEVINIKHLGADPPSSMARSLRLPTAQLPWTGDNYPAQASLVSQNLLIGKTAPDLGQSGLDFQGPIPVCVLRGFVATILCILSTLCISFVQSPPLQTGQDRTGHQHRVSGPFAAHLSSGLSKTYL